MKNPILVPELRELLQKKKFNILKTFLEESHPKEISEYLGLMKPKEIWEILGHVDAYRRESIFSYLDMDVQVAMISPAWRKNVTELLMDMSPDKRADLFLHLDKDFADRFLVHLPISERADVIKLTSYH